MRERRSPLSSAARSETIESIVTESVAASAASTGLRNMNHFLYQEPFYNGSGHFHRIFGTGQLPGHRSEIAAHLVSGVIVGEQTHSLAGQLPTSKVALYEFRHDSSACNQIDHGIKRDTHQKLAHQPTKL